MISVKMKCYEQIVTIYMHHELFFYHIMKVYECENIEDNILLYSGKYLHH